MILHLIIHAYFLNNLFCLPFLLSLQTSEQQSCTFPNSYTKSTDASYCIIPGNSHFLKHKNHYVHYEMDLTWLFLWNSLILTQNPLGKFTNCVKRAEVLLDLTKRIIFISMISQILINYKIILISKLQYGYLTI